MKALAHTKTVGTKGLLTLGMALALVAAFSFTSEARAEGFLVIGGNVGGGHHSHHDRGHYETQYQTVLVSPAHMERQYVPPQYQTVLDGFGRPHTVLVRAGYWTEVHVPAQYATQARQVWVQDYHGPSPSVGLRVGFRF